MLAEVRRVVLSTAMLVECLRRFGESGLSAAMLVECLWRFGKFVSLSQSVSDACGCFIVDVGRARCEYYQVCRRLVEVWRFRFYCRSVLDY